MSSAIDSRSYLTEGYAAGSGEGEWLTVWGSAYDSFPVYATAAAANVRADHLRERTAVGWCRDSIVVRKVRRALITGSSAELLGAAV